jgi:hypothetical protein
MDGRFVTFAIRDDRKSTAMDGRFVTLAIRGDRKSTSNRSAIDGRFVRDRVAKFVEQGGHGWRLCDFRDQS